MSKALGIDLGTINSAAAVMIDEKPRIIPSEEGLMAHGKMFPSVVSFLKEGVIVGKEARARASTDPLRTIMAIKRKMGSDYKVEIDGNRYTPQEISAMILRKIKRDSEAYLGEKIRKAVITVPAYFNDNQRTATKDAAKIAGLEVIRLINEPTAASLAYGLDKVAKMKVAVLNVGGGTFDVTLMKIGDGVFKVISTAGDTQLGGMDMDNKIADYLAEEIEKRHGIDLKGDERAMQKLRDAAEKAKIKLSTAQSTKVNLSLNLGSSELELNKTLTRPKLEKLVESVVHRMDGPLKQALLDSKLRPEEIDKVILVGGPSKMPIVRRHMKNFFSKEPEKGVDPMECVAIGAVIQASILTGKIKDLILFDVTPLSLGIETSGGLFTRLIERNTTIPVQESQIFTTAEDFQTRMAIHVLQGERTMAADDITLNVFNLSIQPAPRHEPRIELTFDIDADGILNVFAEDLETGKKRKVKVTGTTKLSEEEIDRMIKEAEKFAEVDKKRKEEIQARVRANALVYELENTLKEMGNKVSEQEKKRLRKENKKLKEVIEIGDVDKIKKQTDRLTERIDEVAKRIRVCRHADATMLAAKKILSKVPEDERIRVKRVMEKLKDVLKTHDVDKIKKYEDKLREASIVNSFDVVK